MRSKLLKNLHQYAQITQRICIPVARSIIFVLVLSAFVFIFSRISQYEHEHVSNEAEC